MLEVELILEYLSEVGNKKYVALILVIYRITSRYLFTVIVIAMRSSLLNIVVALQISVYERLSKNVLVILISISMRNFRLYQIFQISLSHMAHGYAFYESSLSHLVESLVQLPDVPWSQIQRILSLCPRVDVSPCTVSLRFARLKNSSLLRALFEVSF